MLTLQQAHAKLDRHLGAGPKARHTRVVAHLMHALADMRQQDKTLWEIVGLCHDLDDRVTRNDRQHHGLVAADWLRHDLPEIALDAIRAHDHRTGFASDTDVARALKLADALALADEEAGREQMLQLAQEADLRQLAGRLVRRPYLLPLLAGLADCLALQPSDFANLLRQAPLQEEPLA